MNTRLFPLTQFVQDRESELFVMAAMLEMWGYVYYDDEDDTHIIETEEFLKKNGIPYTKGQHNRKFLHYEAATQSNSTAKTVEATTSTVPNEQSKINSEYVFQFYGSWPPAI